MMKFDNMNLKAEIVRKFGSQDRFADVLGVSKVTVNKKLNGKSQLKLDDIEQWAELLEIPVEDIGRIFFSKEC